MAPWAGKMNRIQHCNWLSEKAGYCAILTSPYSLTINPLLTKLARCKPRYFLRVCRARFRLVHKHTQKELCQFQQPSSWPYAWSIKHVSLSKNPEGKAVSFISLFAEQALLAYSRPCAVCLLIASAHARSIRGGTLISTQSKNNLRGITLGIRPIYSQVRE